MEKQVKFAPFERELPVVSEESAISPLLDLKLIDAVRLIRESTPFEVTFELTKHESDESILFKRGPQYRITKLKVEIKEPIK